MLKRQGEGRKPLILANKAVDIVRQNGSGSDERQPCAHDICACGYEPSIHAPHETGDCEAGGVADYWWEGGETDEEEEDYPAAGESAPFLGEGGYGVENSG